MPSNEDLLFGRLALSRNLVTREELSAALQEQERSRLAGGEGAKLGQVLMAMGLITQAQVDQILKEQSGATGGGKMLGGYELLSKLGSGGMGTVYRARQTSLNRIVALKVLPQKLARDQDFIARFYREARSVARLNHPNIVGGFDVGEADGYHYLAMEYVDGQSATAMLAESPAGLPAPKVLDIAVQTARALEHAHQNGVIHRDIKPENILVSGSGQVKLCDLGLARSISRDDLSITQRGIAVGTPHYISPEQARGEQELDARTDIYSLGATLFHLVAGRPVFTGDNAMQIMLKHLHEQPPALSEVAPSVPPEFAMVIVKCLAKRREDRYPSARALLEDLELVAAGRRPAHAGPIVPGHSPNAATATRRHPTGKISTAMMRAVAARRRRPLRVTAAALAAVLGVGLAFVLTRNGPPENGAAGPQQPANGQARPEPVAVVPAEAPDKARELFDAAFKFAEEHPREHRRQMAMFEKAANAGGSENLWTRRASIRLAQAEDDLRKSVEQALEPVRREAAALRDQKKFAAAAERMGRLPEEFLGEPLAVSAAASAAEEMRSAGAAEWETCLASARKLGAAEDFAGARAAIEPARQFGLPAVTAAVDRELTALVEAEKAANMRKRNQAESDFTAFHREFLELMAARKYTEAVGRAEKTSGGLPEDLRTRIAADLADLKTVQGVWEQARKHLEEAKPGERLTLTDSGGQTITGRFDLMGRRKFDGENFQLLRRMGADDEMGFPFKLSSISTADVLYLAGLADGGKTAADAEKTLFFSVFDGKPGVEALRMILGTAKMRGVDTSRFDALASGLQSDARDREAAEELRRLEGLVREKRWQEVLAAGQRLTETYADTPTLKAGSAQVSSWLRQAREETAARDRLELVFQDGEPVPALGIGYYAGTRDSSLMDGARAADATLGKSAQLILFGGNRNRRVLVRFNLSALPRDANVESARLELFCERRSYGGAQTRARTHRVTSEWEEGSHSWATGAEADGATWNQRGRDGGGNSTPWVTRGGDFDAATDYGKGPGVLDAADAPALQQWLRLDVTPAVRDFVSGRSPNFGFLVICEPKAGDSGGLRLASREALLQHADKRPRLVLTVNGVRTVQPAAPAAERVVERNYGFSTAPQLAAFKAAVQVFRGAGARQPAMPEYRAESLELASGQLPWVLETGNRWGRELEVAVKATLPAEGQISLDLGDKLPDTDVRYARFIHSPANKMVMAGCVAGIGDPFGSSAPGTLGIGRDSVPGATLESLIAADGSYELRFVKQGARLRLESRGLVLAEMALSARAEQELAARPVTVVVSLAGCPPDAGPAKIENLRLGPVRPRPTPPDLPEGRN